MDILIFIIPAAFLFTTVLSQSDTSSSSVVVAGYNISAPVGSPVVLQCVSGRMVWTRDGVRDRQRVVHWDLYRSGPDYAMERLADMFSAGDQRIYNSYNQGRVSLSQSAFKDGNFSLVIRDVAKNDRGLYSCNLHHHYCHLYETVRIQLNVTKNPRKEQRFWDGQKAVYVVLLGSTVVLPCVNRRKVWTDGGSEEEQQVVHWDRQSVGVGADQADRLVDLYASGEQRSYGAAYLQRKMNISPNAFSLGDFSLSITHLQVADTGVYSCHLHHHYCGLHERREFHLTVGPTIIQTQTTPPSKDTPPPKDTPSSKNTPPPRALPSLDQDIQKPDVSRVINVIVPDQRHHFLLPLGYVLTTLLLLAFVILIIILITTRRRQQGTGAELNPNPVDSSNRDQVIPAVEMELPEVKICNQEDRVLEYKNNLLKEKIQMSSFTLPRVIDLDKEMEKAMWK